MSPFYNANKNFYFILTPQICGMISNIAENSRNKKNGVFYLYTVTFI